MVPISSSKGTCTDAFAIFFTAYFLLLIVRLTRKDKHTDNQKSSDVEKSVLNNLDTLLS